MTCLQTINQTSTPKKVVGLACYTNYIKWCTNNTYNDERYNRTLLESILACQGKLLLIKSVQGGRIHGTSLSKTLFLSSPNEITQEECVWFPVRKSCSCYKQCLVCRRKYSQTTVHPYSHGGGYLRCSHG